MRRTCLALAALAAGATTAPAQGWVELERPPNTTIAPTPVIRVSSQVRVTLEGRVARVEVEEQFRNTGRGIAEGTYLYPLPGEAVFTDYSLWMGDQEVRGEMMDAGRARGIYEDIVRRLKDPALLTLEGHGLIRARVFPIQSGETRKVALRYTAMLDRAGDALRWRYALGPRDRTELRGRGATRVEGGAARSIVLTVSDAETLGTPYSPTHPVETRRIGGRLEITVDPSTGGDVELFIPHRRGLVGTSLVSHAPGGDDGFFMLLVAPQDAATSQSVPRDLTLVVDVSGSMSGDKLEQAKAAMRQALGTLGPADRFRLIAFSSTVRHFREGFSLARGGNLAEARSFIDALGASGGTNIAEALAASLESDGRAGRLPIVVFLTDGRPSVGEQQPDRIAESAGGRLGGARLFTVGVGHDVNTYLLDRLAREGRGSAEYVAPDASVEVAVGGLLDKIRHPALVNLRIVSAPVELRQSYPAALPDLFFGEELVVFGRYRGRGQGTVVVEGERNGRRERFNVEASFPATASANAFIPTLWASRRVGELTRTLRLEGASPAVIEEIRELGLRYGILTEYTSYLVQEPGMVAAAPPMTRLDDAALGGASRAREQTGRVAFERAEASAKMARASNLAAADAVAENRLESAAKEAPARQGFRSAPATKRAGGRIFVDRDGAWTDVAHSDSVRIVEIAPYSEAYFALARALPEIVPFLGVGDEVVIAGRAVTVRVTARGRTTWRPGDLPALVRDYRGV